MVALADNLTERYWGFSDQSLACLDPSVEADPVEWCSDNVLFPAVATSQPGLFNISEYPWQRGPFEAFADPHIRQISTQWGTQLGKTAFEVCLICYIANNRPRSILFGLPDKELCRRVSVNKIYPVLRSTMATNLLLPKSLYMQNDLEIDLGAMKVFFGWSGSVSSLAERSCGVIFRDEADKWSTNVSQEADPFYLIEERKKDFIDWKIINSGTPSLTHTSRIEKCIQNSDDRRYWVPCPHCGRYQTFEFEQLVLPHDGMGRLASPEVCAEKVYYPCLHCEKHIEDWHKIGIARRGRWVCAHEKIDEHGMLVPIDPDSPAPPRSTHAGFTLSSLYSLKVTWPEIAREWAKAHADPLRLQNFVNSWLARTFSPKGKQLHESQVLKHRHVGTPHQYPADTCKHEPVACVIVVDVQEASLWYEIFAFCKGNRIYQLRYGQMRGELSNIEMLCNLQFTGPGNQKFGPTHCVIDSGFRTSEVYEFCSVMNDSPTSSFIPFKGTEGQSAKSISWSKIDGEGELELLRIQVDVFKDRLTDIVSNPLTDEPHCWRLHENCEIDFARQLTAERRERKITPLGRYKHVWRRTRADNHYWDINVVALATMQALTWEGWDFSE